MQGCLKSRAIVNIFKCNVTTNGTMVLAWEDEGLVFRGKSTCACKGNSVVSYYTDVYMWEMNVRVAHVND